MYVRWPQRATAVAVHVSSSWEPGWRRGPALSRPWPAPRIPTRCSAGLKWRSVGPTGAAARLPWPAARPGPSSKKILRGDRGRPLEDERMAGRRGLRRADKFLKTSSVGAVARAEVEYLTFVYPSGWARSSCARNIHPGRKASTGRVPTEARPGPRRLARFRWPCARIQSTAEEPGCRVRRRARRSLPGTDARGVYRSRDGARRGTACCSANAKTGAVDLSMDPNAPDTL